MALLDHRSYTTSYQSAIISALSCIIFEISGVQEYLDLEVTHATACECFNDNDTSLWRMEKLDSSRTLRQNGLNDRHQILYT